MKHLSFNGNIVIKNDQLDSFKEEMKNILDKYSITKLSRAAAINVTHDLNTTYEDYKAGRVFKLDIMNKDLYFLFLSVSQTGAIVLVLNEYELEYIKKYMNEKDLFTGTNFAENSIQNLYFNKINYLIPKITSKSENQKAEDENLADITWMDLDFNLSYCDSFDKESIANIIAQFMGRNKKK